MSSERLYLFAILMTTIFTFCVLMPQSSEAKIFDGKREGFIAGVYGGVAPAASFSTRAAGIDLTYLGGVFGFSSGYGVSNHGAVAFDITLLGTNERDRFGHEFTIGRFELSAEYYLAGRAKPWFVRAGIGRGALSINHEGFYGFGTTISGRIGKYLLRHIWLGAEVTHSWGNDITATSGQLLAGVMAF